MKLRIMFCAFLITIVITTKSGADPQCIITQEKETISVQFDIPSFLKNANKTHCQTHGGDQDMLRCGQTNVYIKPECVCSFFHVFKATPYHKYSFCPDGAASDIVTQLKCRDCKKYGLNKKGPCINGGTLICKGEEVAPEVTCQCPPNYEGRLCENRIENITRICDRISNVSLHHLENCTSASSECVTYSRNKQHAYRCQEETYTSQNTRGLPLCLNTENTTEIRSSETNQVENRGRNVGSRHVIFYVYLVLVVSAFAVSLCYKLYGDRKRAQITENSQV